MSLRPAAGLAPVLLAALLVVPPAGAITIDFESFGNGEDVSGETIVTAVSDVTITDNSGSSINLGAAIFDSSDPGPNDSGADPDLLVNSGNILILQNNSFSSKTGDFYDTPNDEESGGVLFFDFSTSVLLESVKLIDINGANQSVELTLLDGSGRERVYDVPDEWTGDIDQGEAGFATLDLTTLLPQTGPGPGNPDATASEDGGFDPSDVVKLSVDFEGSAGLDNLSFVPEPSVLALFLAGAAGLALWGRPRKR